MLRALLLSTPLLLASCQQIPLSGSEARVAKSFDKLGRSVFRSDWIAAPPRRVRHGADTAKGWTTGELDRTRDLARGTARLVPEIAGRTQRMARRTEEILALQTEGASRRLRQGSEGEALVLEQPAQRKRGLRRAPVNLRGVLAIDGAPLPESDDPARQTALEPVEPQRGWIERVLRRIGI